MNKDIPVEPIIAEDFDGPPGFYFEVCPGCHCAVNYLDERCRHCGQALAWKETEK